MDITLNSIRSALSTFRYETARRLAKAKLATAQGVEKTETALLLYDALVFLGDVKEGLKVLEGAEESFEVVLRRVRGYFVCTAWHGFYRQSEEMKRGLSYNEFLAVSFPLRTELNAKLLKAVANEEQAKKARALLTEICHSVDRRAPSDVPTLEALDKAWPPKAKKEGATPSEGRSPSGGAVSVQGRVTFEGVAGGGVPAGASVTLGVEEPFDFIPPMDVDCCTIGVGGETCGKIHTLSAPVGKDGTFKIEGELPDGTAWLAVTYPDAEGVPTRFLKKGMARGEIAKMRGCELVWTLDPSRLQPTALDCTRLHSTELTLKNPFWHDFPMQDIHMEWPMPPQGKAAKLMCDGAEVEWGRDRNGKILFFTDLPRRSEKRFTWTFEQNSTAIDSARLQSTAIESLLKLSGDTATLDTGKAAYRLSWNSIGAPVLAMKGVDGVWRGKGIWTTTPPSGHPSTGGEFKPVSMASTLVFDGALECVVRHEYVFADGKRCSFEFTAHKGQEYLLAEESGDAMEGVRFDMRLDEFMGERSFIHWGAEGESPHWRTMVAEERELARLQESVPWWIPPAGFGWAASMDGLEKKDYMAVFTRRKGEWDDKLFASISSGPPDYEMDWPYPEMVGSTVSMITAYTTADGHVEMRFPRFEGKRFWGLLATSFDKCDGREEREIYKVRHKTSFPRLDDYRSWNLGKPDTEARPSLIIKRDRIRLLRSRLNEPMYRDLWARVQASTRYDSEALRFVVLGDPASGWRVGRYLARIVPKQSRCMLLSRENGDVWSPVGGRCWAPQCLAYDAVVSSGCFTEEEDRDVRAGTLLAGHMFLSADLMNWKYGGRNTNFEADRVEIVGTVGLCFPGNPDSKVFIDHVLERLPSTLRSYCTPGSGKWYENPACYYMHSMQCRVVLLSHLAEDGIIDFGKVERISDFMGWILNMLTPKMVIPNDTLRDGCSHAEYDAQKKVRRVTPVGDHAHAGPWVPDAVKVASRWLRKSYPDLAGALSWAWDEGGSDGGYCEKNLVLLSQSDPEDFAPAALKDPKLASRRLQGYGAVFRGNVGKPDEFMMNMKLGPGGYRYHGTEGSFILFADGRPLVYDGGESGEAWRHSAITYHECKMPPSPGRIEMFETHPEVDYAMGSHPVVLSPGGTIFLNDTCEHTLVAEAYRRAFLKERAAARAWMWVKDEYVVLWDELNVPADTVHFWNVQVMSNGESGSLKEAEGMRFVGRFGTDLQVLMPVGGEREARLETIPMQEYHLPVEKCIAQRHLEVRGKGPGNWLAVLRPLAPGKKPLRAEAILKEGRAVGVHVTGDGIDDVIFIGREEISITAHGVTFHGTAGAFLRHGGEKKCVVIGNPQ